MLAWPVRLDNAARRFEQVIHEMAILLSSALFPINYADTRRYDITRCLSAAQAPVILADRSFMMDVRQVGRLIRAMR